MLHVLMLFHICEQIGFANPSIFLCGCQKDFELSAIDMCMQSTAKRLKNCSATAQQEIAESGDFWILKSQVTWPWLRLKCPDQIF